MAQRFGVCLWPRASSWSPGIESHIRLLAWSLLLPLPVSLPLYVCLSWINKIFFKKSFPKYFSVEPSPVTKIWELVWYSFPEMCKSRENQTVSFKTLCRADHHFGKFINGTLIPGSESPAPSTHACGFHMNRQSLQSHVTNCVTCLTGVPSHPVLPTQERD